jgi:flagellar biosynthesis anti-sigma factor FlgM
MNVNNPNIAPQGSARAARVPATERSVLASGNASASSSASDDVHLSELVRSLRALAAQSPERQNKIEQLTRLYASGSYKVDVQATAEAIIDAAIKR